jgi:hypothetical protein
MSTSSAKLRQLDEVFQRYKVDTANLQAKQSDRVSQIERQVQRVQEFDSKLHAIQADFVSRLNLFEGRMEESMNYNMAKLFAMVQNLNPRTNISSPPSSRARALNNHSHMSPTSVDSTALQQINNPDSDDPSTLESLSSKASMTSAESLDPMQSPEHKKLKSANKGSKKMTL